MQQDSISENVGYVWQRGGGALLWGTPREESLLEEFIFIWLFQDCHEVPLLKEGLDVNIFHVTCNFFHNFSNGLKVFIILFTIFECCVFDRKQICD